MKKLNRLRHTLPPTHLAIDHWGEGLGCRSPGIVADPQV